MKKLFPLFLFIFIIFTCFSFINVNAEELFTPNLNIGVQDSSKTLVNYHNFYTNTYNENWSASSFIMYERKSSNFMYDDCYDLVCNTKIEPPRFSDTIVISDTNVFHFDKATFDGSNSVTYGFASFHENGLLIEPNHHYTFGFAFNSDKELDWNSSLDISNEEMLEYLVFNISDDNLGEYNITEFITNFSYRLTSSYYDFDKGLNVVYLIFDFDIDSSVVPDYYFNGQRYFSSFYFHYVEQRYTTYLNRPWIFRFENNVANNIRVSGFFIEDGTIAVIEKEVDTDSYDYINSKDIDILEEIIVCEDTDIICHIKRNFEMIFRFFVRVGNFFTKIVEFLEKLFTGEFSKNDIDKFFNDLNQNKHGLSSVVTAPLSFIQNLNSYSCNSLIFSLPIVHNQIVLPCMSTIYSQFFGVFFTFWQTLTTGFISYKIALNLYNKVRQVQNPNYDKIEVVDL